MSRRRTKIATGMIGVLVGAALVLVGADPASAATTYSVSVGGVSTGHPTLTGDNVGSIVFQDLVGPAAKVTCTTFHASGPVNAGTGIPFAPAVADGTGTSVADLTPAPGDISGCTNPVAGPVTLTPSGTWRTYVSGPVAGSTTKWNGYVTNIHKHLVATGCSLDVSGTTDGIIDTATQRITPNNSGPNANHLVISNVSGTLCPVISIHNGDRVTISGTLALSPTVAITSP